MAHGCYWKKCSFCDITLDYIAKYEPATAKLICDRIEELIENTGETGFHFVDEAAPPALMKELAIELIRRNIKITWWANIRFEESFTSDLCKLLAMSGCIAVSGGLEVASNRLLDLMEKGVSVEQVAVVCQNFTDTSILVHAYLMYGFPTQTEQETIDSLEMVRQLFELGIVQSGFWHQFAMTYHSPVGKNPANYLVEISGPEEGLFAQNDLYHQDPTGADHELYSDGLKKSLFNYMHGVGLDEDLQTWFDFKIPETSILTNYLSQHLDQANDSLEEGDQKKTYFFGTTPECWEQNQNQDLIKYELGQESIEFVVDKTISALLVDFLKEQHYHQKKRSTLLAVKQEIFYRHPSWDFLRQNGLLVL
jgi:hypothetical protein